MTRSLSSFLYSFVLLAALTGCSMTDEWMGKKEDPPLPGERLAVMKAEKVLQPDAEMAQTPVTVPEAMANSMWPQAGGYPDHVMGNLALSDNPRRIWSVNAGSGAGKRSQMLARPVIANGTIYTLDTAYQLKAFKADTGTSVWSVDVSPEDETGEALGGGIAFGEGVLIISTGFAEILALDPASGNIMWRKPAPTPLRGAPTIAGGRIFAITVDNRLLALSLADGSSLWTHTGIAESAGVMGSASPAVQEDTVIAPYSSGEIYALKAQNGRVAWTDSLASLLGGSALENLADIRALPVIDRGLVLAVSHNGRMVAIDQRIGMRVWEQTIGGINMPWVAGDTVYVLSNENQLVALNRRDGRIHWVTELGQWSNQEERTGRILMSGPVMGGGVLWVTSSTGEMLGIDPETGQKMRRIELPGPASQPPIIAGEILYVLTDNAELAAYR